MAGARVRRLLLIVILWAGHPAFPLMSQTQILDDFDTLKGWYPVTSHGDASKMKLSPAEGRTGHGMLMEFSFLGYMGSAAAEKKFDIDLPANYQISFDLRAEAPVNNFVIRLMDSVDNVWWVNRSNFSFSRTWTKFTIKKHQLPYGWGPAGGGELHKLDRLMLMIDVVEGGKGKIWIDNLVLEPIQDGGTLAPLIETSSNSPGDSALASADGKAVTGWKSAGKGDREWMVCNFRHQSVHGGLVIDWDPEDFATAFDVLLSEDGKEWKTAYSVSRGSGKRSYIYLQEGEGQWLKLDLRHSSRARGYGIRRLEFKGPDFGFSVNDFFAALAAEAPRGYFPEYLLQQQSYWTVVGAPADTREALINEQGMIETDKLSFSLEPFLYVNDHLRTWNDVSISQNLARGYLPIPGVRWDHTDSLRLTIAACADGPAGRSVLLARYTVENASTHPAGGKLFVAVRPFQVNPPWQTFTIVGGTARIDSVRCDDLLRVNARVIVPVSKPDSSGAAEFDQGHVTEYLKQGRVPPSRRVVDHFGYASAALQYDFLLRSGEKKDFVVAVPFHPESPLPPANLPEQAASALYDHAFAETARLWESKLNRVRITIPASAQPVFATIQSNLGYILINADGPGTQPGSRSYERSWIRDGALTCAALLQMGITDEVRRYLDWYAGFQYPDGMIPCIVEPRGADPTPENDSHGEFIYAVMQYFRFTHDTTWLRGKWDNVARTVRYIQTLRAQRKTDLYRTGSSEQRACYGLVPESISHEGYCPKPMHSYWDDFFVMRGLKDAAQIAEVLGDRNAARDFAAERDDFRKDLYASMRLAMQIKNIKYIPGCVELGDFAGLSTTIAITPCDELANLPEPELTATFEESYKMFVERKNNAIPWTSYLPYEARFIGAYVYMDQKERAYDILQYLMRDRRPPGWNHWAEVVWKDPRAPKSIGDMPHSWAASDFIRSVRSMLVYEREQDDVLVVGAGIPESWVRDAPGVEVRDLPTYYGRLNYTMKFSGKTLVVDLSGTLTVPAGRILLKSPLVSRASALRGNGRLMSSGREVVIDTLPAHVELVF
jgi:hypothetical protein